MNALRARVALRAREAARRLRASGVRGSWGRAAVGVAAVAVAGMVAAVIWGSPLMDRDGGVRSGAEAVALATPAAGPAVIAAGRESVWTVGVGSRLVRALPPDGSDPTGPSRRLGSEGDLPVAAAPDGSSLWVALRRSGAGLLVRVAPSLKVARVMGIGDVLPLRIVALPGRVVVLGESRLTGLPARGGRSWSRALPFGVDVAAGYGSVWTLSRAEAARSLISRRDPATGRIVGRRVSGAGGTAIAVGLGAVWVANGCDNGVLRAPVGAGPATCTRVGKGPADVAVGRGAAWVADAAGQRIVELDPATGAIVRIWPVAGRPASIVAGRAGVFATIRGGGVVRVPLGDGDS